jgi:hypothetical protein
MSYAAMHHTVKSRGTFLSWLYPVAKEYPGLTFKALYRQRDWHILAALRIRPCRARAAEHTLWPMAPSRAAR